MLGVAHETWLVLTQLGLSVAVFAAVGTVILAVFRQSGQIQMSPQRQAALATGHTDRRTVFEQRLLRPVLWLLMLLAPFPFIANTFGWMTAELGRQPWLVYGLLRTADGHSHVVSAGNTIFTLIGFMGMYTVLSILFLFLVRREIEHGPEPHAAVARPSPDTPAPAAADR